MIWYEKYRPTELDDYVWTNNETKTKLEAWIENPLGQPHLLLAGPTGTGKTTLAKIIRKELDLGNECKFIPASLRSGVDTIRDEIVSFCEAGGFTDLKLIILDEADRLSRDAQEMLRNVMDRYNEDVRFIFTCNRPEKIISPLQGRMWLVQIEALDEEAFIDRLFDISNQEGVDIASESFQERLARLVDQNYPNMRKAISELQWGIQDGELIEVETEHHYEWEDSLLNLFPDFKLATARDLVTTIRPDEYEQAYKILYENSGKLFEDKEPEAILIIAEHLYRHSQAGLPDITLCACLTRLGEL